MCLLGSLYLYYYKKLSTKKQDMANGFFSENSYRNSIVYFDVLLI